MDNKNFKTTEKKPKKDPKRDMIIQFWHCKVCSNNLPINESMQNYARLEAGWTPKGMQVRCVRCNLNVVAIDLMGQKIDYD